jgi:hypothetical protein
LTKCSITRSRLESDIPRAPVVEVGDLLAEEGVEILVLVLEGVAQLVGEDHLVHRGEGAVLAHRVEPALAGPLVVEARHVVLEHARAQGPQVRPRRQQVEGEEQSLVRARLLDRVLLAEELARRPQALPIEERGRLAEGSPPASATSR